MTSLPALLGGTEFVIWRLDDERFKDSWDSGEGAYRVGGRWNSRGIRAVYCSLDPATAILEVAVHKGFKALDTAPHVLTSALILRPDDIHVVTADAVPNPAWLRSGIPSAGQQAFGDALLAAHTFILIPSAVSPNSWNVIFDSSVAAGAYARRSQERFALDTRLNPP